MWLGPWRYCKEKPFRFKWSREPIRALGIFISYDEKQNDQYNFREKKYKNRYHLWHLAVPKSYAIWKMSYNKKPWYLAASTSILDIPKEYIQNVDTMIFKFIWKNKKDKINRTVMFQDYAMTTEVYARLA